MSTLRINSRLQVPFEEFTISYARSGGPGGQNVNKVESKVLLRWNPQQSPSLPDDIKTRLLHQQRSRLTTEGDLLITSQKTRDQNRNYEDCLEKLRAIIERATHVPKPRKKTRPSRASIARRIDAKKRQSQRKQSRGRVRPDD